VTVACYYTLLNYLVSHFTQIIIVIASKEAWSSIC